MQIGMFLETRTRQDDSIDVLVWRLEMARWILGDAAGRPEQKKYQRKDSCPAIVLLVKPLSMSRLELADPLRAFQCTELHPTLYSHQQSVARLPSQMCAPVCGSNVTERLLRNSFTTADLRSSFNALLRRLSLGALSRCTGFLESWAVGLGASERPKMDDSSHHMSKFDAV